MAHAGKLFSLTGRLIEQMKFNTGIRAQGKLFCLKGEKARPAKTGRTASVSKLPQTDEPDIMYLEETPAILAKKKLTADEVAQIVAENGHRFQGKGHSHRLTLSKRFYKLLSFRNISETNLARRRSHRIKLLIAYSLTGLVIAAALLVFVLPEGSHAATEKIAEPAVVVRHNPRIEQLGINPSLLIVEEKKVRLPDVPTVTSMLIDDSTDAAVTVIDEAGATPEPTPEPTPTQEAAPTPIAVDELVAFYVDVTDSDYEQTGYSTNSYEYTDDELYLLAQIITSEARGETFEGMVAVGNVVMNRVLNTEEFGNTIARVVKTGQFAYSRHTRPTPAAKRAARAVLEDEYWVLPQNVYFFKSHSREGKDWGRNDYYTAIKGHCFYLYPYKGRYNGDGIPPKLYERNYKYAQYGCTPSERVLRIQQMLNAIGFRVNENSYFDKKTRNAIKLFQETNGLSADGVASPDTIAALIKAYGFENYIAAYAAQQAA